MRQFCFTLLVCGLSVYGQEAPTAVFDKAPPHIDEALRARVSSFYQSHVDKTFRKADTLVAEDSKDIFFNMEKRPYRAFEITRINYSEGFSKATIVTTVETEWTTPRLGTIIVNPPMTSTWKVENGEWFWYVIPKKEWETPWGEMKPGEKGTPRSMIDLFKGVDVATVLEQVRVDKNEVLLSSYEASSGEVKIANSMPGQIQIALEAPPIRGLEVGLSRTTLNAGEQASISFRYTPETKEAKATVMASIRVSPSGQVIPVRVSFAVPPEIDRQIPKQ